MARLDDPMIYNPYGWRLADLADRETERDRRHQLVDELVAWEAEEIAHGYRHLTIVHGDPRDLDASRNLSLFVNRLGAFAARTSWVRVRGTADYVTVTVHGDGADERIGWLAAIAEEFSPGEWTVTPTAFPPSAVAT